MNQETDLQQYVSTNTELTTIEKQEDSDCELIPISSVQNAKIQELVQLLPEGMGDDYKITRKAAKKLAARLSRLRHGSSVEIPMMCTGPSCPMSNNCPLLEEDVAPIGQTCPIEKYLTESIRGLYAKDLSVDTQNFVHMTQVNDLVECEILDQRMSAYLGKEGWFEDVVLGFREDGSAILKKDEATSFRIKMRMKSRKDKLLRNFLATREMQAKYNLANRKDPSSYASDLLSRGEKSKVEDAEYEEEETQTGTEEVPSP